MSERTHTLTNSEIRELVGMVAVDGSLAALGAETLIAALPSRQPKDPDAGLGVQPWRIAGSSYNAIMCGQEVVCAVYKPVSAFDKDAVARAILAAPKAIKLARLVAQHLDDDALGAQAAEVVAIADGTQPEAA